MGADSGTVENRFRLDRRQPPYAGFLGSDQLFCNFSSVNLAYSHKRLVTNIILGADSNREGLNWF